MLEVALWSAVRALEEQAVLARRIVERARKANQDRAAVLFEKRVEGAFKQTREDSRGHLHLDPHQLNRPKPSVDMLLSSAAQSYGERGVVMIQNPQTAAYPSMPLSLPPTAVDHVVEMQQIGPLLYDLLKGFARKVFYINSSSLLCVLCVLCVKYF